MSTVVGPVPHVNAGLILDAGCKTTPTTDSASLPKGFPSLLTAESAWNGQKLSSRDSDFILWLSAADIQETEAALKHFLEQGLGGNEVSRENFPLPVLGKRLAQVSRDIHLGRGFALIRGLNPGKYEKEDLYTIYLGIQSHIASHSGRQDKNGNMLVHIVADSSTAQKAAHHRHSTAAITFHNEEAGDVVSWLTHSTANTGGRCIIAPVHTIYNVLASSRPDMIKTLSRSDWPFAFPRFKCRPVIFHHDGRIIFNFGRAPLLGSEAHPRPETLPSLTSRQVDALDAVEAIAKATQLEIKTQAGDMHFINNLTVLHRREGFTDGPQEKRHLVRMILRDAELGWSIPDELQREWHDAFEKDADRTWHLEPMPNGFFPLRINTN